MGRIYSYPLAQFTLVGDTTETVVIAPVNTVVFREICVTGDVSIGTPGFLLLSKNGIGFQRWLLPSYWVGTLLWKGRLVALPADTVTFELGHTSGVVEAVVSGYVLTP